MKASVEHVHPPRDHHLHVHQAGVGRGEAYWGLHLQDVASSVDTGYGGEDGVQGGQGKLVAGGDGPVALVLQVLNNNNSLIARSVPM